MAYEKQQHDWQHKWYSGMWAKRGAIWRCLAQHPEGLTTSQVAKLTGINRSTALAHLAGHSSKRGAYRYAGMPGVRHAGKHWFAEGVTGAWREVL